MESSDDERTVRRYDELLLEDDFLIPSPKTSRSSVNRVAVKPPVFYRSNPSVWFRQMESQFMLAAITKSETKFHYIMSALPEDVAINIAGEEMSYDDLKSQICAMYQKNRQELIEETLGSISLEGQKPSVCFMRIQRKLRECGLSVGLQATERSGRN